MSKEIVAEIETQEEIDQLSFEKLTFKKEFSENKKFSENGVSELTKEMPSYIENQQLPDDKKIITKRDTTIIENVDRIIYPKTNSSSVAFYCPEIMKEEVTYEVRAMLGCLISDERIKGELLDAINETRRERREEPLTIEDIATKEVLLEEYLKIELSDPGNKFEIKSLSNNIKDGLVKIYDDSKKSYINQSFQWIWKVTPKPNMKGEATLTLVITPYDKNKEPQREKIRDYKINITLKQGFMASTMELASRNPEWALASIIAPILSFLVGIFFKREKMKSGKPS